MDKLIKCGRIPIVEDSVSAEDQTAGSETQEMRVGILTEQGGTTNTGSSTTAEAVISTCHMSPSNSKIEMKDKNEEAGREEAGLAQPPLRRSDPPIHRTTSSPGAYLSCPGQTVTTRADSVSYRALFRGSASHHRGPDTAVADRHGEAATSGETTLEEGSSFHPVATMVLPDDQPPFDIPVAEEFSLKSATASEKQKKKKKTAMIIGLLGTLALFMIGGGLALGYSLRQGENDITPGVDHSSMGTNVTSAVDIPLIKSQFLGMLPNDTLSALEWSATPQSKALKWLLADPIVSEYSEVSQITRFALATFYFSTKGDSHWKENTNWLDYGQHECQWYQTESSALIKPYYHPRHTPPCDESGVYRELYLIDNGLQGTVPDELYLITSLRSILILNNDLSGTLSTKIGQITSLQAFAVFANDFSGSLPSELGLLQDTLEGIYAFFNPKLTGSIPSEVGSLSNLRYLMLEACTMTGRIPSEVGALTDLRELRLNHNAFSEGLPTELGNLQLITVLMLYENMLTGPIPSEIGRMTSAMWVELGTNELSGTIPTFLSEMEALQGIWFEHNDLTGNVPEELGLLPAMKVIKLNSNMLSGTLPHELSLLGARNLEVLNVSETLLSGEIPPELCPVETLAFDCSVTLCGCDCDCTG